MVSTFIVNISVSIFPFLCIKEHYLFIVWLCDIDMMLMMMVGLRAIWFSQLSLVSAARESGPGYVCGCYQFLDAPDWKNDIGYITQRRESGSWQSVSPQSFISKLSMNSNIVDFQCLIYGLCVK